MTVASDAPAEATDRKTRPNARPGGFAARLFGYDIFISFALGGPPRGSQAYASDLARRLREQDLSVFYSEDEAAPGAELDSTLVTALHRSKILVVLCNRGTLAEPRWVREEVRAFRAKHPDRPIIPINFGGALQDPDLTDAAEDWLQYRDKIWLDETDAAGLSGITSTEVLDRLIIAPRTSRANQWWRRLVAGTVAVLAALAIGAGIAAWIATERDQRARLELTRSTAQRLAAQTVPMLDGDQPGGQERAILQVLAAAALDQPSHALDQALNAANNDLQNVVKLVDLGTTIQTLAFSADDRLLAMGGIGQQHGDRLEIFDADTLERIETPISRYEHGISPAGISVHSVVFNPVNPDEIAWTGAPIDHPETARQTQQVMIWNLADNVELSRPQEYQGAIHGLAYSPDGRHLAVLSGGLQIWDAATGQPIGEEVDTGNDLTSDVAFSPDGSALVATGLLQTTIWPFDPATGALDEPIFLDFAPQRFRTAFSPDGTHIATGDESGIVTLWDSYTGEELARSPAGAEWDFDRIGQRIEALEYHPNTPFLLSSAADGGLHVRWAETGDILYALKSGDQRPITALAIGHTGARFAIGGDSGTLRIMDVPHAFFIDPKGALVIGEDAAWMGTRRMDDTERGEIRAFVRSLRDRRNLHRTATNPSEYVYDADGSPEDITAAAGSYTGIYLATGAKNGTVRVGPIDTFPTMVQPSGGAAEDDFVPDGEIDATALPPGFEPISPDWTGSHFFTVSNAPIQRLAVSDDGRYVLADAGDGITLWNAETGQLIGQTPDAYRREGWVGPANWVAALCDKLTRNMTQEEWNAWVSPEITYRDQCPDLPIRPNLASLPEERL